MVGTGTGLERLLEGGEADWVGLAHESGRGFVKNEYEMSPGGKSRSGWSRIQWPDSVELPAGGFSGSLLCRKGGQRCVML